MKYFYDADNNEKIPGWDGSLLDNLYDVVTELAPKHPDNPTVKLFLDNFQPIRDLERDCAPGKGDGRAYIRNWLAYQCLHISGYERSLDIDSMPTARALYQRLFPHAVYRDFWAANSDPEVQGDTMCSVWTSYKQRLVFAGILKSFKHGSKRRILPHLLTHFDDPEFAEVHDDPDLQQLCRWSHSIGGMVVVANGMNVARGTTLGWRLTGDYWDRLMQILDGKYLDRLVNDDHAWGGYLDQMRQLRGNNPVCPNADGLFLEAWLNLDGTPRPLVEGRFETDSPAVPEDLPTLQAVMREMAQRCQERGRQMEAHLRQLNLEERQVA